MTVAPMFDRELPREVAGPRSTGWWGMVLVIITEAAFFTTLIASYFYLWSGSDSWPPPGIKAPELGAATDWNGVAGRLQHDDGACRALLLNRSMAGWRSRSVWR
ncbi:MAG: hypothetical protein R2849_06770 [Thermomicrobiales bacterium]